MSRAPRLTGAELISALARAGFQVIRIRGCHHSLRHTDGRSIGVPVQDADTIGPGLLLRILRDCQLSVDQLRKLL